MQISDELDLDLYFNLFEDVFPHETLYNYDEIKEQLFCEAWVKE